MLSGMQINDCEVRHETKREKKKTSNVCGCENNMMIKKYYKSFVRFVLMFLLDNDPI